MRKLKPIVRHFHFIQRFESLSWGRKQKIVCFISLSYLVNDFKTLIWNLDSFVFCRIIDFPRISGHNNNPVISFLARITCNYLLKRRKLFAQMIIIINA